jgi:hypothetical protein
MGCKRNVSHIYFEKRALCAVVTEAALVKAPAFCSSTAYSVPFSLWERRDSNQRNGNYNIWLYCIVWNIPQVSVEDRSESIEDAIIALWKSTNGSFITETTIRIRIRHPKISVRVYLMTADDEWRKSALIVDSGCLYRQPLRLCSVSVACCQYILNYQAFYRNK